MAISNSTASRVLLEAAIANNLAQAQSALNKKNISFDEVSGGYFGEWGHWGWNALHWACGHTNSAMVRIFLDFNHRFNLSADLPNKRTAPAWKWMTNGLETPLHLTVRSVADEGFLKKTEALKIVNLLLKYNASLELRNSSNERADDFYAKIFAVPTISDENKVTIRIWNENISQASFGHASLETSRYYVSLHAAEKPTISPAYLNELIVQSALSDQCFNAKIFKKGARFYTLDEDRKEGKEDKEIVFYSLDANLINNACETNHYGIIKNGNNSPLLTEKLQYGIQPINDSQESPIHLCTTIVQSLLEKGGFKNLFSDTAGSRLADTFLEKKVLEMPFGQSIKLIIASIQKNTGCSFATAIRLAVGIGSHLITPLKPFKEQIAELDDLGHKVTRLFDKTVPHPEYFAIKCQNAMENEIVNNPIVFYEGSYHYSGSPKFHSQRYQMQDTFPAYTTIAGNTMSSLLANLHGITINVNNELETRKRTLEEVNDEAMDIAIYNLAHLLIEDASKLKAMAQEEFQGKEVTMDTLIEFLQNALPKLVDESIEVPKTLTAHS